MIVSTCSPLRPLKSVQVLKGSSRLRGCCLEKPFRTALPELVRLDNPDYQELALSDNAKAMFQANRATGYQRSR